MENKPKPIPGGELKVFWGELVCNVCGDLNNGAEIRQDMTAFFAVAFLNAQGGQHEKTNPGHIVTLEKKPFSRT